MFIRKITVLFFLILSLNSLNSLADEGMWIPSLLQHYNIDIMQGKGLKLTAEDIYSINQASLKDAVVIFGRGCTGVMVSPEGLVFTNHHCGYGSIQRLSSIENDFLKHGFWAMNRTVELPVPELSVTFLIRIEDVTSSVLKDIDTGFPESKRKNKIEQNIRKITQEAGKDTHYKILIRPFYYGNEYYMFVYEEFTDVRLVGTPPSSVGNFGSDPDNWIWPRHTGDFSLFRVYADCENKPAAFSPSNVPYKPVNVASIYTGGLAEGEFTMVMGYPGTTTEYLISPGVEIITKYTLPFSIKLRDKRMEIMERYMRSSELISLQYAAKFKTVSNAWKKWQGTIRGLDRANAVDIKKQEEEDFNRWAESENERKKVYGSLLSEMSDLYEELKKYSRVYDYYQECFMATEIFSFFRSIEGMLSRSQGSAYEDKINVRDLFLEQSANFFKNYHQPLDEEIFASMLAYYSEDIDPDFHPSFFPEIRRKFKGDFSLFARSYFRKSNLLSFESISMLLSGYPDNENEVISELFSDPLYKIFSAFSRIYTEKVFPQHELISDEINMKYRVYVRGLREKEIDRQLYPDANFTMRITYGKAEGYQPYDAITYHYHTTLTGKIEKFRTGLEDYDIPEKLLRLYEKEDYGRWKDSRTGELHTCFIASNHTSGGNSGSPVFNSYGHLVGLNFDRNWEGTMSDIMYDPLQCRNISVDIRYVLFIIDKFADAGYLLGEMNLIDRPELFFCD